MKQLILLLLLNFTLLYSQSVKVKETIRLTGIKQDEYYHPHFTANDEDIIVTKSNYKGLYKINLKNQSINEITDEYGSGYKPVILPGGKILYKSFKIKDGRKFHSLKFSEIDGSKKETIESEKRMLSLPMQINGNDIYYRSNGKLKSVKSKEKFLQKTLSKNVAVYSENNSLYVIENGFTREISPLGKGVYVWESVSADGEKIIFTFGNKGTFVCDLTGKILFNIPEAHYPKFSPNGKFISYMIDEDNGYNFTASDIYVYSVDEKKSYKITSTQNKIEMFAEWSNAGNSLVYNTTEGEIYLVKLEIKN